MIVKGLLFRSHRDVEACTILIITNEFYKCFQKLVLLYAWMSSMVCYWKMVLALDKANVMWDVVYVHFRTLQDSWSRKSIHRGGLHQHRCRITKDRRLSVTNSGDTNNLWEKVTCVGPYHHIYHKITMAGKKVYVGNDSRWTRHILHMNS